MPSSSWNICVEQTYNCSSSYRTANLAHYVMKHQATPLYKSAAMRHAHITWRRWYITNAANWLSLHATKHRHELRRLNARRHRQKNQAPAFNNAKMRRSVWQNSSSINSGPSAHNSASSYAKHILSWWLNAKYLAHAPRHAMYRVDYIDSKLDDCWCSTQRRLYSSLI